MKKSLLFLLTFLLGRLAFAQQGEILYEEPNLTRYLSLGSGYKLKVDVDHDGEQEWAFGVREIYHLVCLLDFNATSSNYFNYTIAFGFNNADHDTLRYGDSIHNIIMGTPVAGGTWYEYRPYPWVSVPSQSYWPSAFVAVRRRIGDNSYCYGWIEVEILYSESGDNVRLTLKRHAYCTQPDYPLCVGQTSFNWNAVDDTKNLTFASIQPNPNNGHFTVVGQNLKSAEIFNALGQKVASTQGEGDRLMLDLSAQPAGIYFVNITDSEGRKCVRKVLKK